MIELERDWPLIRTLVQQAFQSSFHFAFASVNADGTPHITPIGSLLLHKERPRGYYFEIFTSRLPINLQTQRRIAILAVNNSRWLWLKALWSGRFKLPPAIRLIGTVRERRLATADEVARWQHKIRWIRWMRGSKLLWDRLTYVREIDFDACYPVNLSVMTR